MKLWMDVMRDLEYVMNDHERIFAAWAEGGVVGVVFGPQEFNTSQLLPRRQTGCGGGAFVHRLRPEPGRLRAARRGAPNRTGTRDARTASPARKDAERGQETRFQAVHHVPRLRRRTGRGGHHLHDEKRMRAGVARMVDTLEHFPMADGAIMDGPEWGYEIAPHHMDHRSYIFGDLPESMAPLCAGRGTTTAPWWQPGTGSSICCTSWTRGASACTREGDCSEDSSCWAAPRISWRG